MTSIFKNTMIMNMFIKPKKFNNYKRNSLGFYMINDVEYMYVPNIYGTIINDELIPSFTFKFGYEQLCIFTINGKQKSLVGAYVEVESLINDSEQLKLLDHRKREIKCDINKNDMIALIDLISVMVYNKILNYEFDDFFNKAHKHVPAYMQLNKDFIIDIINKHSQLKIEYLQNVRHVILNLDEGDDNLDFGTDEFKRKLRLLELQFFQLFKS